MCLATTMSGTSMLTDTEIILFLARKTYFTGIKISLRRRNHGVHGGL